MKPIFKLLLRHFFQLGHGSLSNVILGFTIELESLFDLLCLR